jgi:hypothetical protein
VIVIKERINPSTNPNPHVIIHVTPFPPGFSKYRKVVLEFHLSVDRNSSLTSPFMVRLFVHVHYLVSTVGHCPVNMNILAANIGAFQKYHKNQNGLTDFDYNSAIYGLFYPRDNYVL